MMIPWFCVILAKALEVWDASHVRCDCLTTTAACAPSASSACDGKRTTSAALDDEATRVERT
jgi:hypothetical protein